MNSVNYLRVSDKKEESAKKGIGRLKVMGSNYSIKYNIDIVMCIDATGSMGRLINTVKKNALSFHSDLVSTLENSSKHVDHLRVRVIAFRDYVADKMDAMLVSSFFELPNQSSEFEQLVNSIEPFGGGDDDEDGLEALAYAIKSDWTTAGTKKRHIIIVWSDDGTHQLGFGSSEPNYPKKMAKDFDTLTEWWGDSDQPGLMDNSAKRLIIYAPDKNYWSTISDTWEQVLHFPSSAGTGLKDLEYEEILNAIKNSI